MSMGFKTLKLFHLVFFLMPILASASQKVNLNCDYMFDGRVWKIDFFVDMDRRVSDVRTHRKDGGLSFSKNLETFVTPSEITIVDYIDVIKLNIHHVISRKTLEYNRTRKTKATAHTQIDSVESGRCKVQVEDYSNNKF